MYVSVPLSFQTDTCSLTGFSDKWEDPTVRNLTPRLIPIFQAVLTGDSGQLDDERRAELIELVSWLNKMQPGVASWIEQPGQ